MQTGNSYYLVNIKIDRTTEDGMLKTFKENYLIIAASPTEAEKIATDEFVNNATGDFEVTMVKKVNYSDIIINNPESKEYKWFEARINFVVVDESNGKEKRSSCVLLFCGDNFKNATDSVIDYANKSVNDIEILSVSETKIIEVVRK